MIEEHLELADRDDIVVRQRAKLAAMGGLLIAGVSMDIGLNTYGATNCQVKCAEDGALPRHEAKPPLAQVRHGPRTVA